MTRKTGGVAPMIGVRVEPVLRDKLVTLADAQGRSVSNLARYILNEYITFVESGQADNQRNHAA
jgi:CopG-like RHH_1 or ribbon-helix-helix domain, RHH_5